MSKKPDEDSMRDVAKLVSPLSVPAVHLVVSNAPARSYFGGSPRLPPEVKWPERDGSRLSFLARLSLTDIHRAHPIPWLPKDGALLFFYDVEGSAWGFDPKDRGSWAVLHVPDVDESSEMVDDGTKSAVSPIARRNIGFQRISVLPGWERSAIRSLDLDDCEGDEFSELCEAPFEGQPKHQVSGYPAPVQGDDMELECQLVSNGLYCGDRSGYEDTRRASLAPGAADWRLLFQFDTDDDLGVMWGDCGVLYFWVQESAARSVDFANTWFVLQCS